MTCKKCGRELSDSARFCKYCGERCAAGGAAAEIEQPRTPQRGTGRRILIFLIIALLIGTLVGFAIYWISGDSQKAPSDAQSQQQDTQQQAEDTENVPEPVTYAAVITAQERTVEVNEQLTLTAALDPEPADDVTVEHTVWSSDDTGIAAVENGVVTGKAVGTATITVVFSLSNGSTVEAAIAVEVVEPEKVYTLKLSPAEVEIQAGKTTEVKAAVAEELENDVTITQTIWHSDDSTIASVENGKVAGVKEGTTAITAEVTLSNGQVISAAANVRVTAAAQSGGNTGSSGTGGGSTGGGSTGSGGQGTTPTPTPAPTPAPKPTPTPAPKPTPTPTPAKPTGVSVVTTDDYVASNSAKEYLSIESLQTLTNEQLRLARNELYARHGRIFNDEMLKAYFSGKSWYNGTVAPEDFNDSCFSAIEEENLARILKVEASRK